MSGTKKKAGAEETAPETVPLVAIGPIEHDGVRYEIGDKFGVPETIAERLIAAGAAERAVIG